MRDVTFGRAFAVGLIAFVAIISITRVSEWLTLDAPAYLSFYRMHGPEIS
jgi:hypothetical protein